MKKELTLYCFLLFISLQVFGYQKTETNDLPNIILINVDDMGWRDTGFMGSQFYETPNLDLLASKGMIFNQAYAAAANCAPSRACMMSGENTPRHGVYTVGTSERGRTENRKLVPIVNKETIADHHLLFPELLQQNGYITCHSGKWHISQDPLTRGFNVNIGGSDAGNPGSYYPPYRNVPGIQAENDAYLTDLVMDKTLDFIANNQRQPFFLNYSPYAVHTPIQPVTSLLDKYLVKSPSNGQSNAKYATMVENLDRNIGRLIDLLHEKDMFGNTFIFFITDNGGLYKVTKQRPLRAGKGSYYEGGIRVPAFAVWPGRIRPDQVSEIPITNLDIFPTLLELTGIKQPENKNLDGLSLLPLLTEDKNLPKRPLFWHFPIYLEGGNGESQDPVFRTRPGSAVRYGDWKLIQYFENNAKELYNLKEDISESNNLVNKNTHKAEELLSLLENWREKTNAPIPETLNPLFQVTSH
ncbi:sulfatase [Cyclobacterium qasimii]|uniref:Arylsulfatase n=2 Tax=Cyclobacterium qasimii TaxID=1350429 RepID=S7V5P5_9BACT|nr:sulfatase [Cyclobacterium qasimii]EPR65490.1 Arylsulfatase [Cyclobacterium qasimii M12-11B]GEO19646.1 aryl-sulfate sulfohydrolase [Cyclobacterium qasimii]